jgi:hypothetical protein
MAVQIRRPWMTYCNTYFDHPPDYQAPRRWPVDYYSAKSFDVWGGGLTLTGKYTGYRGKPLPRKRGNKIFKQLFNAKTGPEIDWIIYAGEMWWNPKTGGPGWTSAPPGPADSDPGHWNHLHVTYVV